MRTIEEIRLDNLLVLITEQGSTNNFCEKIGKSYAQVNQWVNRSIDHKSKKPRSINSLSARNIEDKCNKPAGWMDNVHDETSLFSKIGITLDDMDVEMIHMIKLLTDSTREDKRKLIEIIKDELDKKGTKKGKIKEGNKDKLLV